MRRTETIYRQGQRCIVTETRIATPLPPSTLPWRVVKVASRYEIPVSEALDALDLKTFCPLVERVVTQGRKTVFRGHRPLLPGYVFVAMPGTLPHVVVTHTTGVSGFLTDPASERPLTVPTAVLEALASPRTPILSAPKVGSRIRIASGPLAGLYGAVERVSPGMARVIVEIFAQKTPVTIPLDAVA